MEFWSTIVGLVKRKGVIIPVALVAMTLGTLAYLSTPTTYVSSTTMVLTTTEYGGSESQDPTKPTDLTNPMLNFNASLQTTSAILIETMGTKEVQEELGTTDGSRQVIINDGRTNPDLLGLNGPFLYIEGRSTSAAAAHQVVVDAQRLMQQRLMAWQSALNAPKKTYVALVDVVSPTAPVADSSRATKLGVMAFLFGFVLSLGIAYFGHQVRARRRARRAAAVADGASAAAEAPERARTRRVLRSPALVHDVADDEDGEPFAVPTARNSRGEPVVAVKEKAQPTIARAPAKTRVRSRNR